MQGHCIKACYWSTPFELLCAYCAAHGSQLSAFQPIKFMGAMKFIGALKGSTLNGVRKVQEVLLKLEADIAALPTGQDGYTAPGKFIFELLAKVNLTEETFGFMLQLLEEAMNLLSDEALAAGRKYALLLHWQHCLFNALVQSMSVSYKYCCFCIELAACCSRCKSKWCLTDAKTPPSMLHT